MINSNIFKPQFCSNRFQPRTNWVLLTAKKFEVSLIEILADVCKKEKLSEGAIRSKSRKREIVEARQIYFKRARKATRNSLQSIGEFVGRDHATVLHGIKTIDTVQELSDRYDQYFNGLYKPKRDVKRTEKTIEPVIIKMDLFNKPY